MVRSKRTAFFITLLLAMALVLAFGVTALAVEVDPDDVFLKMPTKADLDKEYDGKQPDWVDFDYDIDPVSTLWVNDESKGADGSGLVYLDVYRWDEASKTYKEFHMGNYPGNMEGAGFNMDEAGFFNYGPPYGEQYYSLNTIFPGMYKAIWLVPIYGTNTPNFNLYQYVEYEVEFEIKAPGIFTAVAELSRDANGEPVDAPEIAYDLSKATVDVVEADVKASEAWFKYDAAAENFAGQALSAAPSEIGKYVYKAQVTDGALLDQSYYAVFELTDPDYVEPWYRLLKGDMFTSVPPTDPSKVFDGKPVTFDDFEITYDVTRTGNKVSDIQEDKFEYIWYMPNRYGKFADMIAESQGKKIGPMEVGTYNFQFGIHGLNGLEGFIYAKFTISAPTTPIQPAATPAFKKAIVSPQNVLVNGVKVDCDVYNIDGNNYFKLRDVAAALADTESKFYVGYSAKLNVLSGVPGLDYTKLDTDLVKGEDKSATCQPSKQPALFDGKVSTAFAYNIGGNNFFKVRDLGEALGFGVDYDDETNTVLITSSDYVPPVVEEAPAEEAPAEEAPTETPAE